MGQQAKSVADERNIAFSTKGLALSAGVPSLLAFLLLSFLLSVNAASAAADVQGVENDLRVNAHNATLIEILDALKSRFKFSYQARSYNSQLLTGTYSGSSLRETLERVLDGNNYILKSSERGLELTLLSASAPVTTDLATSRLVGTANANPPHSAASPPPLASYLAQNRSAEARGSDGTP
jgi:hypothetical protein